MGSNANEAHDFEKITSLLYQIISPVLIIFGTFGNILTIKVLFKRRSTNASTVVFLSSLALSDLLVLNTGLLRYWIRYTFDVDIRTDLSEGGCRLQRFAIFLTTQFSSWMLVCVTLERFVSTWFPNRRSVTCSTKISFVLVSLIFGILFCLNSHYLFGFGNKYLPHGNRTDIVKCVPLTEGYEQFIYHDWPLTDMFIFYVIPMIVLVASNTAIVYKVIGSTRKSRRMIAPASSSREHGPRIRHRTSSLTITLVMVSAVFILCVAPIVVYPIGEPYWKVGASPTKLAMLTVIETVAVLVMYVNHAVNFVLYFLSGPTFRRDVKKILCRRCTHEDVEPSASTCTTGH